MSFVKHCYAPVIFNEKTGEELRERVYLIIEEWLVVQWCGRKTLSRESDRMEKEIRKEKKKNNENELKGKGKKLKNWKK